MAARYNLTASDVPGRRTRSLYTDILQEFHASGEGSVLVEIEDKKPQTLRAGLRRAIKSQAAQDVRQAQRGEETYLVRPAAG